MADNRLLVLEDIQPEQLPAEVVMPYSTEAGVRDARGNNREEEEDSSSLGV